MDKKSLTSILAVSYTHLSRLIPIGRLEKDKEVIQQMYDLGVSNCNNQLENLKKYLRG